MMNLCFSKFSLFTVIGGAIVIIFGTLSSSAQSKDDIECARFLMEDNKTYEIEPEFVSNSMSPDTDWLGDTYYTLPPGVTQKMVEEQNDVDLSEVAGEESKYVVKGKQTNSLRVSVGYTREEALDECQKR